MNTSIYVITENMKTFLSDIVIRKQMIRISEVRNNIYIYILTLLHVYNNTNSLIFNRVIIQQNLVCAL